MARKKTARTIARMIEASFKQRKKQIEESMQGLDKGSRAYLDRVIALAKLEQSYRTELAERGLIPQNLGVATQPNFVFRATITPSSEYEWDAKRQAFNDELDREYMNLPAADPDDGNSPPAAPVAVAPRRKR